MAVSRQEIHEMVDQVDPNDLAIVAEVLRPYAGRDDDAADELWAAFVGSLHGAERDFAARSEDILRNEL